MCMLEASVIDKHDKIPRPEILTHELTQTTSQQEIPVIHHSIPSGQPGAAPRAESQLLPLAQQETSCRGTTFTRLGSGGAGVMAVEDLAAAGNSQGRAPSPAKRKRMVAFAADEATDAYSRPPTKKARLAADLSISRPDDRRALETVESKYDVQIHSIVSSTKIQKKVVSVLRHLQESDTTTAEAETAPGRPRVIVLRGPAAVTGKLVSIAEIAKREVAAQENGHWFQYIALGQDIKESPRERPAIVEETILDGRNTASKDDSARGSDDEEDEDDDFEYMKTPFERALEGKPKKHAVAVMSLFLARAPVDELKRRFGEQNNTTSAQTKT